MKSELKVKLFALVLTAIVCLICAGRNIYLKEQQKIVETNQVLEMESVAIYNIEDDLNDFVELNLETFEFYSKTFGISLDDLKSSIIEDNEGSRLNYNDLGNTNNNYESLDENLIDYLFNLSNRKSNLFNQTYTNGNEYSKEYIYGLLNYYSSIYDNVDFETLAAIAYIESGNLNSNYMLKNNNIYGGMSSNGLIKYKNIEYGVLSYVKLMSEKYYGKGLTTIETIAKKYNLGSTTWIKNVKSSLSKFKDYENVDDINTLISMI